MIPATTATADSRSQRGSSGRGIFTIDRLGPVGYSGYGMTVIPASRNEIPTDINDDEK